MPSRRLVTQRSILFAALSVGVIFLFCDSRLTAQQCESSTVDTQGADIAKASCAFLAELQTAVRANDKEKIAGMISYPLNVNYGTKRTRVRTKNIFLAQYDSIFTEQIRKDTLDQSSQCLFGNDNGAMVGNGDLWFSGIDNGPVKIYAVNVNAATGTSH
jgi:hypothetical protein